MTGAPKPRVISRDEALLLQHQAWDMVAPQRAAAIDNGEDWSFSSVILPTILTLVGHRAGRVLDVGCGTGHLTVRVAPRAEMTLGIDPSIESIRIARMQTADRVEFRVGETAALGPEERRNDTVLACMVMQDVVNLTSFVGELAAVTRQGGILICAITHPAFWPRYWRYENEAWFDYESELFISSEFRSANRNYGIPTLHVHRPLQCYLNTLQDFGFDLLEVVEPVQGNPVGEELWLRYPRFVFMKLRRR